jgi:hypothetical protein
VAIIAGGTPTAGSAGIDARAGNSSGGRSAAATHLLFSPISSGPVGSAGQVGGLPAKLSRACLPFLP